jgi:hypothetical protein
MAQSTLGETLDADGWKALFMANGIKEDSAKTYGDKFATEEVTFGMLSQLDRDLLKEMGVNPTEGTTPYLVFFLVKYSKNSFDYSSRENS